MSVGLAFIVGLCCCLQVVVHLKNVIKAKYGKDATNVGDEGGFAPNILENNEGEAFAFVSFDRVFLCVIFTLKLDQTTQCNG